VANGFATLNTEPLSEGAWTLQSVDQTWIRGVIVAQRELGVPQIDGDVLIFDDPVEPGSRAWALYGPDRALTPLSIVGESPTYLHLDVSNLDRDLRTDVMVLSGGRHLARMNIFQTPERSSAMEGDIIVGMPVGCACTTGTRHPSGALLSILLMFFMRRRFF
jgi:MYXO-CTERM domain-containing protein